MRILYLTPGCFDKGGISRYSRYQISALREVCGSENVRVLSLLGPDANAFEDSFGVDWHGTSRPGEVSLADRAALVARALGLAATWRPEVVLSAHVNFGPLLTTAGRLAGAGTVLNVYGLEVWSGLSQRRCTHLARTGHIIADCHFTAHYVVEKELHPDPPTVIWDCVDLERFDCGAVDRRILAKYGIPNPSQHFVVLSLGRLAKAAAHKGFDRLIEVVATLAPEAPALRLVIAGHGDDRLRLETLAAELGIHDRVFFTGSVDEADLPGVYRCAHVFSLVSDRGHGRGEGIPLTPLEAMACGAPIIVGNEDGSQEAVVMERNGFIVSARDPAEHRAALQRLLRDPSCLSRMRAEARRVAESRFGYDAFVAKHKEFLVEAMQRSASNAMAPEDA